MKNRWGTRDVKMKIGTAILMIASTTVCLLAFQNCGSYSAISAGAPASFGNSQADDSYPTTEPNPPLATTPATVGEIVDPSLSVDPAAYRKLAEEFGRDAGIEYRYGPASTVPDTGLPVYYRRPDTKFTPAQQPQADQRPDGMRTFWQVGGPVTIDPGNYFSNMANVMFTPNNQAAQIGVSIIQQLAVSNNVMQQLPQLTWIYPDGMNDPNAVNYRRQKLDASHPVAMGRCARPGWCVNSIVAYHGGLIGTARGSNTSLNEATAQLKAGLVPTAVAETNAAEFALVTTWDPVNVRGAVAVVALAGMCNGCNLSRIDGETYWGEWRFPYPGLQNLGNIGFMKVIGYIDLPDMRAPTEIAVSTGWSQWDATLTKERYELTLSNENNRASFMDPSGINRKGYARAGIAVVISKSEKKASFIDLRPLFAYYKKMYFGARADFDRTANIGNSPGQWPSTFTDAPEQIPKVIKTISLAERPTAVKISPTGSNPRAWIATQDGELHLFDVGNYTNPLTAGQESEITETGKIAVGKNPTGLAFFRNDIFNQQSAVIVVSRADRKVQWVKFAADHNSGTITRTLQDVNMKDPIAADDNESNGSNVDVISVADYKTGVLNYRSGPAIFNGGFAACQGAGCPSIAADGGPALFEFGGNFVPPGKVFNVSGANVP